MHRARREAFGVEAEVADHVTGEALSVGLVVDAERFRIAEPLGVHAQDAHARGVEGGDPHRTRHRTDQRFDAVLHLAGRLVGEGDGEDVGRMHTMRADEMGDAVREHARLARAGASHHEEWTVDVFGGVALGRVQSAEIDGSGSEGGVVGAGRHGETILGNGCGRPG